VCASYMAGHLSATRATAWWLFVLDFVLTVGEGPCTADGAWAGFCHHHRCIPPLPTTMTTHDHPKGSNDAGPIEEPRVASYECMYVRPTYNTLPNGRMYVCTYTARWSIRRPLSS